MSEDQLLDSTSLFRPKKGEQGGRGATTPGRKIDARACGDHCDVNGKSTLRFDMR